MEVVLLTKRECDLCDDAHHTLERLAHEYPLRVVTIDLDTPEGGAVATRHGFLFPPGVLLDGRPFSYGRLSERKLRRELERRLAVP